METLAEVVNTGADSVTAANQDTLDPFTTPPTNDMFIDAGYTQLFSRDLITNSSGTYFFQMEASKIPKLIDLRNLMCEVTFQVVKMIDGVGYGVLSGDNVGLTNHFVDSLFSSIEIIIGSAPAYVSPQNRYHYVQISHLVSENKPLKGAGKGRLSISDPEVDPEETYQNRNPFFAHRSDRICAHYPERVKIVTPESTAADGTVIPAVTIMETVPTNQVVRKNVLPKDVFACGVLTTGFTNSKQFLPWNSEIIVNVTKEQDSNLLHISPMSASETVGVIKHGEYKVIIKNLSLSYRHYVLNDSWYKKHLDMYNAGRRCKIFYLKPYTNSLCIQNGEQMFFRDISFPGRRLAKMFLVFMSSDRFVGNYKLASNSYRAPPKLQTCELLLSGRDPLQLDAGVVRSTDNSLYDKLYFDYLHNAQVYSRETPENTITFEQFKSRAFILSLNMVASGLLESEKLPLLKSGSITLRVVLDEPLQEAWYVYYVGYGISLMEVAPGLPPQLSEKLDMEQ